MVDTSRDPRMLHPYLQEAWEYLRGLWVAKYPQRPAVKLSATYRGPIDQNAAYDRGASPHRYPMSLHNTRPAYAFDVYFEQDGRADWSFENFELFGRMAEEVGLEWGGRWPNLVDGPHIQFWNATIEDAMDGFVLYPPIIPEVDPWKLVVMRNGQTVYTAVIPEGDAVVTRFSERRKRVYVDVRDDNV